MSLKYEESKMFQGFNAPASLEGRLTAIRKRLKEKYDIDHVEIDGVDKDKECIVFNIGSSTWEDYLWKTKYIFLWSEVDKEISLSSLNGDENRLLFPQEILTSQEVVLDLFDHTALRASIMGKYRSNAYAIMFSNKETGQRIQFCISFENNRPITNLSRNAFFELMNDLKSAEHILKPFVEYFAEHGNIQDSLSLDAKVRENPFHLRF